MTLCGQGPRQTALPVMQTLAVKMHDRNNRKRNEVLK